MELKFKLKDSIPSNTFKVLELYNKIDSGQLSPSPNFQRKLVWKKQHKFEFIKTILMNLPFPEVYIASTELDVDTLQTKEVVVDGQQRLTTIVDYIKGTGDFSEQKKITPFSELERDEKREFLNYPVSVKDLKDIGMNEIKEIFQRINSTYYSLNSNETLNAQYGDGEFAIFAKQLVDEKLNVDDTITDVIVPTEKRNLITSFFESYKIFKENDIKRMFDSQFIMLLASTILEQKYFGRNTKIDSYLELYNAEFKQYSDVVEKLLNSIKIIEQLKLPKESYWFNKANLFTLIIEFQNLNFDEINFEQLEYNLLDMEEKFSIYFDGNEDDIKLLSSDEIKYFEVARQGSHELASRDHRGKIIREIIGESLKKDEAKHNIVEVDEKFGNHAILIPTQTGLKKSIMDATSSVREFLKNEGIHDYDTQEQGPDNKALVKGFFVDEVGEEQETKISMYKSNGRGDFRIWFSDLGKFVEAGQKIAITVEDQQIKVYRL